MERRESLSSLVFFVETLNTASTAYKVVFAGVKGVRCGADLYLYEWIRVAIFVVDSLLRIYSGTGYKLIPAG